MVSVLFRRAMIVAHKSHHQQVRERAQQNHAVEEDIVEGDLKDRNQHDPNDWNQAAEKHEEHM
jgi:hypothetical protein